MAAGQSGGASERVESLDSVRGLAAVAVIWSHLAEQYGLPPAMRAVSETPLHALWDGHAAVVLFFVLSGFVLARRYVGPGADPTLGSLDLPSFAVARICRVWLPYVAALLASAAAHALWFPSAAEAVRDQPGVLTIGWWPPEARRTLFGEALLAFPSTPHILIPQGWSLTSELCLSLIVPAMCLLCMRGWFWLAVTVSTACWLLRFPIWAFHFALGVALARWTDPLTAWISRRGRAGLVVAAAASVLLYSHRHALRLWLPPSMGYELVREVTGVGCFLLLLLVLASGRVRRVLEARPLVVLGRVSYGVYLLHAIPLLCAGPYVYRAVREWMPGSESAPFVAVLLAVTTIAIAAAGAFHRVVEVPSIALGRRLARRVARGRAA